MGNANNAETISSLLNAKIAYMDTIGLIRLILLYKIVNVCNVSRGVKRARIIRYV